MSVKQKVILGIDFFPSACVIVRIIDVPEAHIRHQETDQYSDTIYRGKDDSNGDVA